MPQAQISFSLRAQFLTGELDSQPSSAGGVMPDPAPRR
jgi:hypothetical protein